MLTINVYTLLVLRLCGGSYPNYILAKAAALNNDTETTGSLFYPLYDKILNYWFPPTEDYDVCPCWSIPGQYNVDSTITFVIEHHHHPLLLIEVKPPSHIHNETLREIAIAEISEHLHLVGPSNMYADQLYAISAIGKNWRACYALKGEGSGQSVKGITKAKFSVLSGKKNAWNPDITSDASWKALQEIVETIKGYVAQSVA